MAGRRTRTNTITLGNMPPGRLNPTIGFGGEGRRTPDPFWEVVATLRGEMERK